MRTYTEHHKPCVFRRIRAFNRPFVGMCTVFYRHIHGHFIGTFTAILSAHSRPFHRHSHGHFVGKFTAPSAELRRRLTVVQSTFTGAARGRTNGDPPCCVYKTRMSNGQCPVLLLLPSLLLLPLYIPTLLLAIHGHGICFS